MVWCIRNTYTVANVLELHMYSHLIYFIRSFSFSAQILVSAGIQDPHDFFLLLLSPNLMSKVFGHAIKIGLLWKSDSLIPYLVSWLDIQLWMLLEWELNFILTKLDIQLCKYQVNLRILVTKVWGGRIIFHIRLPPSAMES